MTQTSTVHSFSHSFAYNTFFNNTMTAAEKAETETVSFDTPSEKSDNAKSQESSIRPEDPSKPQNDLVPADTYSSGLTMWLSLLGVATAYFIVPLDVSIVATAIPKITDQFQSIQDVAWYGSAFMMALGGFQSAWGKAYKYLPIKPTYLASVFIFEIGSLLCAVAPSSMAFVIGRAIAGVGAAGIACGTMTIIAVITPPQKRPFLTSLMGAVYGISSVVGPLLGGAITEGLSWRWCFYINLPFGAVAAGITLLVLTIPSTVKPPTTTLSEKLIQFDVLGTLLAMAMAITLVLALQCGGTSHPWSSPTVIGLLVGFILIIATFVLWELYQGDRAAVPQRLLGRRYMWVNSIFTALFAGSFNIGLYWIPIYFQSVSGDTPMWSGIKNISTTFSVAVTIVVSGLIASKTGIAAPLMPLGATVATVGVGLLYMLDIGTGPGAWIGFQIVAGMGWGSAFQIPMIVAQGTSDTSDISSVTAIILFFQTFGGSFTLAAAQAAFSNQLIKTLPRTAPDVAPDMVIATGATELRHVFAPSQVTGILEAYVVGLQAVWAVAVGITGLAVLFSLCSRWQRLDLQVGKTSTAA
ncbi:putative efflux pump gsfJ [Fulvia fulva]|nr:putative efflux pump gsfJ [Fulvia fulva]WPV29572.1 putative efflux pump gsfJ [Fulvia fulva]